MPTATCTVYGSPDPYSLFVIPDPDPESRPKNTISIYDIMTDMNQGNIRNFCIIAHIDHGKSTLADRMMEMTNTVQKREMKEQLLDSMDLEREKGITIKLTPVRMQYDYTTSRSAVSADALLVRRMSNTSHSATPASLHSIDVEQSSKPGVYQLNLIDTPGHVDFSYEVSRSLQACEGAILVVDASQGIQAQTLANVYLALEQNLTIIPVLNKIDLPAADVTRVSAEVINLLGCSEEEIIKISAKTGDGVKEVLDAVVERILPPVSPLAVAAGKTRLSLRGAEGDEAIQKDQPGSPRSARDDEIPTRALIFDSYYDDYRGVVLYVRVVDGKIGKNDAIHMIATGANGIALEVGHLSPGMIADNELATGEIGYIVTNLKTTRDAKVGDTVTLAKYFKESK